MEIDRNPQEVARRMIHDGIPLEKVARMTKLDSDTLQEIVAECRLPNITAPQNPQRGKLPHPAVS